MISQAIKNSSIFLALLSHNSISKRGFVQKELKIAIEVLDEFSPSDIFIIPVRIDEVEPIEEKLSDIQWVDLFSSYNKGLKQILEVINLKTIEKKG